MKGFLEQKKKWISEDDLKTITAALKLVMLFRTYKTQDEVNHLKDLMQH